MPAANPLNTYDAITANTKIQFKAGTQAALNNMIINGGATEGTFYLTTDTHKLYIGRKKTSGGAVYPEQVSRGVTVVGSASQLPTPPSEGALPDAPANAIEEGELFYITDTNVLAALHYVQADPNANPPVVAHYEWVQINPPTGISNIFTNAVSDQTTSTSVNVLTTIRTDAGLKKGAFQLAAGDNVTLSPTSSATITSGTDTYTGGVVEIAAQDTVYQTGTEANASSGIIGLKSSTTGTFTQNQALDSTGKITISGDSNGWAAVSSTNDGTVSITGPSLTGLSITPHTVDGFAISATVVKGNGTSQTVNSQLVQPHITYGVTTTPQQATAAFANGTAHLDVYTTAEADAAIDAAIDAKLATANAMEYKGTVDFTRDDFVAIVSANGAHNGDTYKVSGVDPSNPIEIDSQTVAVGDLIIISAAEDNNTHLVPFTPGSITSLLGVCDLVPSGDEPLLTAAIHTDATGSTIASPARFKLFDGKIGENSSNILTTRILNGQKIIVKSNQYTNGASGTTDNKLLNVIIDHATESRTGDNNNISLSTSSSSDTIGTNKYKLFVLDGDSDPDEILQTDGYGHVTGFQGKVITFEHNYITNFTTTYSTGSNKIAVTLGDLVQHANKAIQLAYKSDTLQIGGYVDAQNSANNALSIDLVWGTF